MHVRYVDNGQSATRRYNGIDGVGRRYDGELVTNGGADGGYRGT